VKGLTARHPEVPARLRGTYLGLATDPVIQHLLNLGVTSVELLPVHHAIVDRYLFARGLTNYWGYNTLAFFAPDVRYATAGDGAQVAEFKTMVKRLHRAGLEVLLDVVYNHTGEGDQRGPTLSLRGIDNAVYYRLDPADPRYYVDVTGCGNTLNLPHPRTTQLVLDSLRYWVEEMHVDGFRFDLAPALGRGTAIDARSDAFFEIVRQDPVLARVKLIAEPWDLGPHGDWGGGLSGRLVRVERPLPRRRPPLLARRLGPRRRPRVAPVGLERPLRSERPERRRQHQLRDLSRRLHAARSR
jgi:glycogen operon protein